MKKGLLLAVIGMLFFSSCDKDSPETLILGKWFFDTEESYSQNQYTNKYKRFCREHSTDSVSFDEERHGFSDVYYAYWEFTSHGGFFYYQYNDGDIFENKNPYQYHVDGNMLSFGTDIYEILTLNEQNLTVQIRDTTYFYDEDYEEQIAWIEARVYQFKDDLGRTQPGDREKARIRTNGQMVSE